MSGRLDDEAFSDFVTATWPRLYRTAYLLLGDRALAEDLVQTSLAKVYANWHRVREPAAAPGYARTTMVNTATAWFRKQSWRAEHPTETPQDRQAPDDDPEVRLTVMAALDRLPSRQRAVIVLRYFDDLPVADTASALGCSAGTVKSQTHDALVTLRRLLGDDVIEVPAGRPGASRPRNTPAHTDDRTEDR